MSIKIVPHVPESLPPLRKGESVFTVATEAGRLPRVGRIFGPFAVSKPLVGEARFSKLVAGWQVTHLGSGRRVTFTRTLTDAKALIRAFEEDIPEFGRETNPGPAWAERVRSIMARVLKP